MRGEGKEGSRGFEDSRLEGVVGDGLAIQQHNDLWPAHSAHTT